MTIDEEEKTMSREYCLVRDHFEQSQNKYLGKITIILQQTTSKQCRIKIFGIKFWKK